MGDPGFNMFEQYAEMTGAISMMPKKLNKKVLKNLEIQDDSNVPGNN